MFVPVKSFVLAQKKTWLFMRQHAHCLPILLLLMRIIRFFKMIILKDMSRFDMATANVMANRFYQELGG